MKTIARRSDLKSYGIDPLTAEACSLGIRMLCDLTARGQAIKDRNEHQIGGRAR